MTGILTEQKLISDCRYRVIKSSFLVPVLFREVFSHPYISFFHLLVNDFSVIKLMSRCLSSAADDTSLPTSLTQEQAAKTKMVSVVKDPANGVFSIVHSYFETFGYCLPLVSTSTNIPTAQKNYCPTLPK